jgi:predicted transglutaminase-like cysteine proteinase
MTDLFACRAIFSQIVRRGHWKTQSSDGGTCSSSSCAHSIVKELNGQGHVILTGKTHKSEFILSRHYQRDIRPWNATGYRFLKRQSKEDPNV